MKLKRGMALRLAVLLTLFSVLAAVVAGYYIFDSSRARLQGRAEQAMMATTQVLAHQLQLGFTSAARDTALLAGVAAIEPDRVLLASMFQAYLQAKPTSVQVRFISVQDHGLERVRIDRIGNDLVHAREEDLQEKAHFPFVFETLALKAGEVYMSEFGINHEGAADAEAMPVFSIASPVVRDGQTLGVVVVRVQARAFLRNFDSALPSFYDFYLTNRWGDFLVHPDPSRAFGFDRGQRIQVQDSFAPVAALIGGSQETAVFSQPGAGGPERVFSFARMPYGSAGEERFLVVGLSQPLAAVQGEVLDLGRSILKMLLVLSGVGVLLAAWVSWRVTRPLQAMVRATQAFSQGQPPGDLPLARQDEIGELARSFHHMAQQIGQQMAELDASHNAMSHLAHHDALTDLPNRRMFTQRLAQALERARRSGSHCALLFLDLDGFKRINDAHGHAVGDQVLQAAARTIVGAVRSSDTVARLAGDEFTVLCEHLDSEAAALQIVGTLRRAFDAPLDVGGSPMQIAPSIGLAVFPRDGQDAQTLLAKADAAMYRSKRTRTS